MSYRAKRNITYRIVLSKRPDISITRCTRDVPETKIDKFLFSPLCRRRQWGPPSRVFWWYLGYYPGVNLPGPETDSSHLSNYEVKNEWSFVTYSYNYVSLQVSFLYSHFFDQMPSLSLTFSPARTVFIRIVYYSSIHLLSVSPHLWSFLP
jgi:hypothetical protein